MSDRKPKRRLVLLGIFGAASLVILALSWPLWAPKIGDALIDEDPLQKADAILVLGAARIERTYEAGQLHKAELAPIIILSQSDDTRAIERMTSLGVRVPTFSENQSSVLVQMGVPEEAIVRLPGNPRSTAEEARLLAALAHRRGLRKVIVVTSRFHTARAGIYFRKAAGDQFKILVRGSRHDSANADEWWKRRGDQFDVLLECLKLPKAWLYPASRLRFENEGA